MQKLRIGRLNHLPEVTQLLSSKARIWSLAFWFQSQHTSCYVILPPVGLCWSFNFTSREKRVFNEIILRILMSGWAIRGMLRFWIYRIVVSLTTSLFVGEVQVEVSQLKEFSVKCWVRDIVVSYSISVISSVQTNELKM